MHVFSEVPQVGDAHVALTETSIAAGELVPIYANARFCSILQYVAKRHIHDHVTSIMRCARVCHFRRNTRAAKGRQESLTSVTDISGQDWLYICSL